MTILSAAFLSACVPGNVSPPLRLSSPGAGTLGQTQIFSARCVGRNDGIGREIRLSDHDPGREIRPGNFCRAEISGGESATGQAQGRVDAAVTAESRGGASATRR